MIAISGVPGSGKTKLASLMADRINQIYASENPGKPPAAAAIPMDGYHYTRAQLAQMPNPEHATFRRGAAFTFDGEKFIRLARALRQELTAETPNYYAPNFDHAVKDPVEDDITIPPTCRIIFFEGNYLGLDKEPWREVVNIMDELWFVQVDFETARRRLVQRHLRAGLAGNEIEADRRATENDLFNGKEIVDHKLPMQETVVSHYDPAWEK